MQKHFNIQQFWAQTFMGFASNKIPRVMKLYIFLLCCSIGMTHAADSYAQRATVCLKMQNQTVQTVLNEIENQSEFSFFFNTKHVDLNRKVSVDADKSDIFNVLDKIFSGTNVRYSVVDRKIILSAKVMESTITQQSKRNIAGVVKDQNGEPVAGANVSVKGTTTGTITDSEGKFQLFVSDKSTIIVSYIGYQTKEISIGKETFFDIQLNEGTKNLEEVVITALGIKREEKALGYAVQKINTESLTSAKGIDVGTSLTGKVAGLNVQNSTEFNASPVLKLRGETPILIIDGIPYGNMSLNEIASDDIESIDVLKGATASALYGARGSTGAIMVTTKRGTKNEGINVEINSNTMFFSGYLAFPEVQSSYSRGYGGKYNSDYVWGDKLDIGRIAVQYDPYTYEWKEMPLVSKGKNNFKNFLEFSMITNNNISVSQKGKYGSFRTSMTYVYNKGQYPNEKLNKMTYTIGGEMSYGKFKFDGAATYNKRISSNDNGSGYSSSYIYDLVIWGGTEYYLRDYKNYWVKGQEDEMQNWYDHSWYDNPYFKAYEVIDAFDTDILNAYANTSYEITPYLKAVLKGGLDFYSKRNEWRNAKSANYAWDKNGFYGIKRNSKYSINTDAMLMFNKTWDKLNVDILGGGNIYYYSDDMLRNTTAGGLSVPGFYSLKASINSVVASSTLERKRMNSLYGKASFSWASTYFIDITGRNDWSSTLSKNARSYFYPSFAGSIVLSEIIPLPRIWNFWKIRGSWTTSKEDARVYDNNNVYSVSTNVWDGLSTAYYPSSIIGGDVRPQKSVVSEYGTAVNFLNNRLYADFAYYRKVESDFIISGGISSTTGFSSVQTNSKEERLRMGVELTIGGTPVNNKNFQWDVLTNWGHDKYTYKKIDPEYSTKRPWVNEGETWDWIAIYDWDRDPDGNIIHNGGIPVKQNFISKVGKTTPDLVWGITNSFRYKHVSLNFTIDGRVGGMSFSRTHQMLWNSGAHIDSDNEYRYEEVVNGNLTYIGKGVKVLSGTVERDPDGNIISDTRVYAPNDVVVSYEAYISKYHDSASKPSRQNMLDETFIKLRNLTLSYNLPKSLCNKLTMKSAAVSLTGQNLFMWAKDYKYADPDKGGDEGSMNVESLNAPSQRYIGVNLKVNF